MGAPRFSLTRQIAAIVSHRAAGAGTRSDYCNWRRPVRCGAGIMQAKGHPEVSLAADHHSVRQRAGQVVARAAAGELPDAAQALWLEDAPLEELLPAAEEL